MRWIKAIEKTQESSDPPSPTHAFARRPSRDLSQGLFDAAMVPHLVGNLAVQQLFRAGAIKAKLAISQPNDPDEQEADRIADQAMSSAATPIIHRKCAACEAGGALCPKCADNSYRPVQRKEASAPGSEGMYVPDDFAQSFGAGYPLPPRVRGKRRGPSHVRR